MIKENLIDLSELNCAQAEAVRCVEGASLIIAGAGSGKTRVLTYKIAYLLSQGVPPSSILALTFTNKASKEMKERIAALVGRDKSVRLWMGTFHSIFARILRDYAELLGFPASFTIYDTSDTRSAIRLCLRELELDEKVYKPAEVLARISKAKNNLVTANAYANNAAAIQADMAVKKGRICDIYKLYAKKCFAAGVMDFDDILLFMNILLRDHPEVTDALADRFAYILVDEYQDTNFAQYLILKKLAAAHQNISVVGDDSQSIYGFRGARIQNILTFKADYPQAKIFRLEQNYRSTRTIVDAANSLIEKNGNRLKKTCFSDGPVGEKIEVIKAFTEQDEGASVVSSIIGRIHSEKASYEHFAILYRTNSQSRIIEEMLRKKNLPYKIYAGHSFYERAEVKSMLAYLRLVVNKKDDEAFRRIINFPARSIGETSMEHLAVAASAHGVSLWEAVSLEDLDQFGLKPAIVNKMKQFTALIDSFKEKVHTEDAYKLSLEIANMSGVIAFYKGDNSIESQARMENVEELLNSVNEYVEEMTSTEAELGNEDVLITLESYLENVALLTDMDSSDEKGADDNKIKLMTVHSSKGLEFPYVYIIGMEENLFPSSMSLFTPDEVEEERRLFYVALTRAEKAVAVSFSRSRFRWGQHVNYPPSRFLKEIDQKYLSVPIKDDSLMTDFDDPVENNYFGRKGGNGSINRGDYQSFREKHTPQERVIIPTPSMSKPIRTADPNFIPDDVSDLQVGQKIEHDRFGDGIVVSVEGHTPNNKAVIDFEVGGRKTLLLKFAKIKVKK